MADNGNVSGCCPGQQTQEYPMTQLSLEDWQMVTSKCISGAWPQYYYIDNNWPLRKIHVWPLPSANYGARLYLRQIFTAETDLDAEIDLPYGYEWMIIHQIAMALLPDYGIQPSQALLNEATDSMSVVRRSNETVDYQYADPAFNQGTDLRSQSAILHTYTQTRTK